MSMTYRVVPQGEDPAEDRFNGEGGVRKEWWWQAGPVDSCCCCCSLRAGVATLAMSDLLVKGIWGAFYSAAFSEFLVVTSITHLQAQYGALCAGDASKEPSCVQMVDVIVQAEHKADMLRDLPGIYYVAGYLSIVAGLIGLWAVFRSNALAAKMYMWTWPASFVLGAAANFMVISKQKQYGVDRQPLAENIGMATSLFSFAYYLKVVWSYRQKLQGRPGQATSHPV
ncbi:unnamed protein product [Pylaiella littoralis]